MGESIFLNIKLACFCICLKRGDLSRTPSDDSHDNVVSGVEGRLLPDRVAVVRSEGDVSDQALLLQQLCEAGPQGALHVLRAAGRRHADGQVQDVLAHDTRVPRNL